LISIIICSRRPDISPELSENIRQTIGVAHECIVIDNSENRYSIFSAYNEGVRRSRYPLLLFMHDDIAYRTGNWGARVFQHFVDGRVGAVGIAGTTYLPSHPCTWWSPRLGYQHIVQPVPGKNAVSFQSFSCDLSENREVVALDGVWFCIRRSLFEKLRFDESTYKGFHFYDIDTTLQVYLQGYRLICATDILIEHRSLGTHDEKWIREALAFHRKWKGRLPVATVKLSFVDQCEAEYRALDHFTGMQIDASGRDRKIHRAAWLFGLKRLLAFRKGYFYFKTPVWVLRYLYHYLKDLIPRGSSRQHAT
jgi:hypothetical protein